MYYGAWACKVISILAHIGNPNQGVGLVRTALANRRKAKHSSAETS
jgi:hypothetical protein